jgi:hypothetical protein
LGTRLVSWPNKTARSIAPAAITASTISELMPALASTAGNREDAGSDDASDDEARC